MNFRLNFCWRSICVPHSCCHWAGNSSCLITTVQVLTPIRWESEDGINKWKADYTVKPTKYPTINRGFIPGFRFYAFRSVSMYSAFNIESNNKAVLWFFIVSDGQTETCTSTTLKDSPGLKLGNRDPQALHIVSWTTANKCWGRIWTLISSL
jgi:hypothetical protein